MISFTSCCWLTSHTIATTSLQGALHVWDIRQAPAAGPAHACVSPGVDRAPLLSLAAHPALHHNVAVGDSRGSVLFWDLRVAGGVSTLVGGAQGSVSALAFSPSAAQLVLTTTTGLIASVGQESMQEIYREPGASIEGVCLTVAGAATQLFAPTDQEGLIFMANLVV